MSLNRPVAPDPYLLLPSVASFTLTSSDIPADGMLPPVQAYAADNLSPGLSWTGAPQGTRSYLLSCYDPDAPTPSGFWHWFVAGIPGEVTDMPAGAGGVDGALLPRGASQLRNDFGSAAYGGAAPPPGDRAHRYIFAVQALDVDDVGIDADTSPAKASFLALDHIIGRATLTGWYAEPAQ